MENPYLIQRCEIKESWNQASIVSEAVKLEYMGSSEFEWGAIPDSLKEISKRNGLEVFQHKNLFVLCKENELTEYKELLDQLEQNKIRTKERVWGENTDLWIDLRNSIVFSKNEKILKVFQDLTKGSVEKIKENERIKEEGDKLIDPLTKDLRKYMSWTFIVPKSINSSEGARSLKGKTNQEVVFWLNGPQINNQWFCGFYTFEDFQQMAKNGTGPLAEKKAELENMSNSNSL